MSDFLAIYDRATEDGHMQRRIAVACALVATDVFAEQPSIPARITWARAAVSNASTMAGKMSFAVVARLIALDRDETDAQIRDVVASLVDHYSLA